MTQEHKRKHSAMPHDTPSSVALMHARKLRRRMQAAQAQDATLTVIVKDNTACIASIEAAAKIRCAPLTRGLIGSLKQLVM